MRTFDGTKCKVGDVVCDVDKYTGNIIDITPDDGYNAVAVRWHKQRGVGAYNMQGYYYEGSPSPAIYLPDLDPLDEIDPSPGNVSKLTRRQVGKGYRIPTHDEIAPGNEDIWISSGWTSRNARGSTYCPASTYRVPIKPATILLEASDIKLGRTLIKRVGADDCERTYLITSYSISGVFIDQYNLVLNWIALQSNYEISFDGGDTWQRAEKVAKP